VAGTSAGAIVGTLLSVGYSPEQLKQIMFSMKIQTFNDGQGFFIGGQKRLRKNFGWYRGEKLEQWIGKLIGEKTGSEDLTFKELHELSLQNSFYKELFVTATNLTKQKTEVFSFFSSPDMKIKTAVRISISVPLYFAAVFLNEQGEVVRKPKRSGNYQVYIDGGILANYPLDIFDTIPFTSMDSVTNKNKFNNKTLGFKVERPEQIAYYKSATSIAPYNIHSFRQYISALYNIIIENLNRKQPFDYEMSRTIFISTDNISPKVRRISLEQKQLLFQNGKDAANQFLNTQK
jgi:NTE family protein